MGDFARLGTDTVRKSVIQMKKQRTLKNFELENLLHTKTERLSTFRRTTSQRHTRKKITGEKNILFNATKKALASINHMQTETAADKAKVFQNRIHNFHTKSKNDEVLFNYFAKPKNFQAQSFGYQTAYYSVRKNLKVR